MAANILTTFWKAFSWMMIYKFRLIFQWSSQGCNNQWWLVYWRIYASLTLNELRETNKQTNGSSWCGECNISDDIGQYHGWSQVINIHGTNNIGETCWSLPYSVISTTYLSIPAYVGAFLHIGGVPWLLQSWGKCYVSICKLRPSSRHHS